MAARDIFGQHAAVTITYPNGEKEIVPAGWMDHSQSGALSPPRRRLAALEQLPRAPHAVFKEPAQHAPSPCISHKHTH